MEHPTPVGSKVPLKTAHFFGVGSPPRALSLSRRYGAMRRGVTASRARSIDRYLSALIRLHLEKTSASASSAFAPPAMTGPNGEQFLESEQTDASRRFLPHRQIIAFDFSLRFLPSPLPFPYSHPFVPLLLPRRQPSSPSPRKSVRSEITPFLYNYLISE